MEPVDQYDVERFALADRNLNVPCESGIRYPSLVVMHNRELMTSRITVIYTHPYVHTITNTVYTGMYWYVLIVNLTNCVLCRPTQSNPLDVYALTSIFSSPAELSCRRMPLSHPWHSIMGILHLPLLPGWSMITGLVTLSCDGCPQSLLNGLAKTCKRRWDFLTRQTRERARELGGHRTNSIISCRNM